MLITILFLVGIYLLLIMISLLPSMNENSRLLKKEREKDYAAWIAAYEEAKEEALTSQEKEASQVEVSQEKEASQVEVSQEVEVQEFGNWGYTMAPWYSRN